MNIEEGKKAYYTEDIEALVNKILSMAAQPFQDSCDSRNLTPKWKKAGQTWITNTSIIQVLSDALKKPKIDIVDILAEETKDLDFEAGLKIAIEMGFSLMGPDFKNRLISHIYNRITTKG